MNHFQFSPEVFYSLLPLISIVHKVLLCWALSSISPDCAVAFSLWKVFIQNVIIAYRKLKLSNSFGRSSVDFVTGTSPRLRRVLPKYFSWLEGYKMITCCELDSDFYALFLCTGHLDKGRNYTLITELQQWNVSQWWSEGFELRLYVW